MNATKPIIDDNGEIRELTAEDMAQFRPFSELPADLRQMLGKHQEEREAVRAARKSAVFSQQEFARLIGIPLPTLRAWEQGTRKPTAAARALLKIAAYSPETVREALAA